MKSEVSFGLLPWPCEGGSEPSPNEPQQSSVYTASEKGRLSSKMVSSDSGFCPQGLNKTFMTMDQERPRCELSINSRNDLRRVLHLEFLYKENKVQDLAGAAGGQGTGQDDSPQCELESAHQPDGALAGLRSRCLTQSGPVMPFLW